MADPPRAILKLFVDRLTSRSLLTDEECQAILELPTRERKVDANRDYVRLGEQVDHCSLIAEGVMGRFSQTSGGARQITALHVPGDVADLHSVVRPVGTAALQALSQTRVLRISHADLRSVAARFPAVAEAFWRDCMVDAAILSQWVLSVGRRDARTRIAHLLCEIAVRTSEVRSPRLDYPFPVTQIHVADATGLTSVHVNRMLKSLREDGIVNVRAREVNILDWDRLAAIAEFDAAYLHADTAPDARQRMLARRQPDPIGPRSAQDAVAV